MEYVYHGSKIKGLKKLTPKSSTHQKKWVYASPAKAAAIIFISNGGSDLNYDLSGRGTKESPFILVERKKGMFDELYNLSGSLYTMDSKNFKSGKTGWSAEVVSEFEEKILNEEHIDNILMKLEELANNGELQLCRYPDRPEYVPLDNSDLIHKVINWYKRGFDIKKFLDIYPELEAQFYEQLNNYDDK